MNQPTPYPEVNTLLHELMDSVQAVLGSHFIGMYLDGSLANGDFDQDSDIDFVVVTDEEIRGDLFLSLQAMHDRIAMIDSPWAIQLEGSYISKRALRRYDPANDVHPNIQRGMGERLKLVDHGADWDVHRFILRTRGIMLAGPPPQTLVDPVPPDQLRQAMLSRLSEWATRILHEPAQIKSRGYQSYVVLSLCRILYTLQFGTVTSKPVAARWAQEVLGERWVPLIERTWASRHNPGQDASAEDVDETLAFIQFTLQRSESLQIGNT